MQATLKMLLVALLGCAVRVSALVEQLVHENLVDQAQFDFGLLHAADDLPLFKLDELAAHNVKADCWVGYAGKVYDASALLAAQCPADAAKFVDVCGRDVTDFLRGEHKTHFGGHLVVRRAGTCPRGGGCKDVKLCPAFQFHELFRLVGLLEADDVL